MSNSEAILEAAPETQNAGAKPSAFSSSPLDAFSGTIEPTRVSATYKIGMAVVALAMLLLPAIYIGLIVLTGYGVWIHLTHNAAIIKGTHGGGNSYGVLAYLGPVVAGAVLIFFMVKPLFAARQKEPAKYSLTPQSDPELFAFIVRICELIKAPQPTRVDVDCQVNASASFRRGWSSLAGNDVVLTIGLPLVAGMTMQEFAGVLAHEFGHFTQGAGMRLTYVVRQTNYWFARVVYERDEWDVKLAQFGRIDIRLGIFLQFTRLVIWLSRRILWVFMQLGHAISCFMLRQMEYDADSYETRLSGSEAFARTVAKLNSLNLASLWAHRNMQQSWHNKRLPDNLPGFISLSVNRIPPEATKELEMKPARNKTGIFDTHPCDADRVRAAQALNQKGIFHLGEPAARLFHDFEELSKAATRFHYENWLALKVTDGNLVAHEDLASESRSQEEGEQAWSKYFFGLELNYRPLILAENLTAPSDAAGLFQRLLAAREAMEHSKDEVKKALAEYEEAEQLLQRGLNTFTPQQATFKADATMNALIPTLAVFENHAQERLAAALQLLHDPAMAGKIPKSEVLQNEAASLTVVFAQLGHAFIPLHELRRKLNAFVSALNARHQPNLADRANRRIAELKPELEKLLVQIRASIQGAHYPFQHVREGITLEDFAKNDKPSSDPLKLLCNNCASHINRLVPLYHRVLGRLLAIATKVEEYIV